METKVSKNIVEPRSYQLYGDDIESKQAVEPIALVCGTGPICGFNYIDVSDNTKLVISGLSNPNLETVSVSDYEEVVRTRDPRRWLSTKANQSGVVVNAYTTPDGLVHIAPEKLTFNFSPEGGWPKVNGEPDRAVIFALKAKHTYSDQEGIEDTPSQENFEVTWVDGTNIPFLKLVNGSYQYLLERILPEGWLDTNTESFLGLYIVGWNYDTWNDETGEGGLPVSHYEPLVSGRDIGYKLCLVPYGGVWPVTAFIHGPLEYLVDRDRYSRVSRDITTLRSFVNHKFEDLGWVPSKAVISRMIDDLAITTPKLASKSVTNDKIADSSVNSSKLANNSVTTAKLSDELRDIADYRLRYYNIEITRLYYDDTVPDIVITSPITDDLISLFKVDKVTISTNYDQMTITLQIGTPNIQNRYALFLPGTIIGNVYTKLYMGSLECPFLREVIYELSKGTSLDSGDTYNTHKLTLVVKNIKDLIESLYTGVAPVITIRISALTNRKVTVY